MTLTERKTILMIIFLMYYFSFCFDALVFIYNVETNKNEEKHENEKTCPNFRLVLCIFTFLNHEDECLSA